MHSREHMHTRFLSARKHSPPPTKQVGSLRLSLLLTSPALGCFSLASKTSYGVAPGMRACVGTGTSAAAMLPIGVSTVKSPYPPLPLRPPPLPLPTAAARADAAAAAVASERNSRRVVAEGRLAMTPLSTRSSTAESGRATAAPLPLPLFLLLAAATGAGAEGAAPTAVGDPPRTGAPPLPSRADSTNRLRLRRASTRSACRRSRDAI